MIIALEEARLKLVAMRDDLKDLGHALRIEQTKEKTAELEAKTQDPNFWNDQETSSSVLRQIKQGQDKVEGYEKLCTRLEDAIVLAEMSIEANDESSLDEVQSEVEAIRDLADKKRIEVLLSGEYDRTTPSCPSTRAPAAPRRRTGRRCSTA